MTIGKVIERLAKLKPHAYTHGEVIEWLSAVEGRIYAEIIRTHENPGEITFTGYEDYTQDGYTGETSADTELIAPHPYDELYLYYLMAQADLHNLEYDKYNSTAEQFNAAYKAFSDFWNREFMPVQRVTHFGL